MDFGMILLGKEELPEEVMKFLRSLGFKDVLQSPGGNYWLKLPVNAEELHLDIRSFVGEDRFGLHEILFYDRVCFKIHVNKEGKVSYPWHLKEAVYIKQLLTVLENLSKALSKSDDEAIESKLVVLRRLKARADASKFYFRIYNEVFKYHCDVNCTEKRVIEYRILDATFPEWQLRKEEAAAAPPSSPPLPPPPISLEELKIFKAQEDAILRKYSKSWGFSLFQHNHQGRIQAVRDAIRHPAVKKEMILRILMRQKLIMTIAFEGPRSSHLADLGKPEYANVPSHILAERWTKVDLVVNRKDPSRSGYLRVIQAAVDFYLSTEIELTSPLRAGFTSVSA